VMYSYNKSNEMH